MNKKTYAKPQVIDFSLEGVTGVGAGTCDAGISATTCGNGLTPGTHGCNNGVGASLQCGVGSGASSACNNGFMPYGTGELCGNGGTATSDCYGQGATASRCTGNGQGVTLHTCESGNTDSMPTS